MGSIIEPRWPLVGREVLLDSCASVLRSGRGIMLIGPAGVGKTRLAHELAGHPSTAGALRLSGALGLQHVRSALADRTPGQLIVIDDAHELDDDVGVLLAGLAVHGDPILATIRSGSSVVRSIEMLWRDDIVERIDVAPLTREATDHLLDAVLDGPIDGRARRRFWELTSGSPLYLRELVRASLADGSLTCRTGMWRLAATPHSVRLDEVIIGRVEAVTTEVREVVELVAVGEPLGFEVAVAGLGHRRVAAAEESGLVEVVRDRQRRDLSIVHPVIRDLVSRLMPEARRAAHCARLLEMVAATPMQRDDDIVRTATWQLRAGGSLVDSDMVLAARRALYGHDERLAVELASRVADPEHPDAVLILGEALVGLGQHERAERVLHELGGVPDDTARGLIAIRRAITLYWGLGDAEAADAILAEAELSAVASEWRDEIRAERAVIAATRGDFGRARELSEPLLSREDNRRIFVTAAIAGSCVRALGGQAVDGAALADRAYSIGADVALGPGMSEPSILIVARALALSEAGELCASESLARIGRDVSVSGGELGGQAWFSLVLGRTLLMRGHLSEADALFVESAGAFSSLGSNGPRRWALAGSVLARAMLGDVERVETAWSDLEAVAEHPAMMMGCELERAAAWVEAVRGDRQVALDRLRAAAVKAADAGAGGLANAALHDVARLGGRLTTEEVDRAFPSAQGRLAALRADHLRAIMDADPHAVEQAACGFADIGADLFAAEAALRASQMFARRDHERDAARCRRAAANAQRKTNEEWLATLEWDEPCASMTDRELEVARLAATGRTNREIADGLSISVRTVENHLSRVYWKLGIEGRTDLDTALLAS